MLIIIGEESGGRRFCVRTSPAGTTVAEIIRLVEQVTLDLLDAAFLTNLRIDRMTSDFYFDGFLPLKNYRGTVKVYVEGLETFPNPRLEKHDIHDPYFGLHVYSIYEAVNEETPANERLSPSEGA